MGTGSDSLYLIHKARSAALCSPVQDAEHFRCILESFELVLNKSSHCLFWAGETGCLLYVLMGGRGSLAGGLVYLLEREHRSEKGPWIDLFCVLTFISHL